VCTAIVAGSAAVRVVVAGPRIHLDAETLAATGLLPPWREEVEPVVHYLAGSAGEDGVALASRAVTTVQGYGGPVNLLVATDAKGVLRRAYLLEHRETPSYLEGIDPFLASFEGKSLLEAFQLRLKGTLTKPLEPGPPPDTQVIDALTGATVTSQAVVEALAATGKRLAEPVFGTPYGAEAETASRADPRIVYLALSLLTLLPVLWFGGRWLRRIWLFGHAAVGGVILGVQFSTVQILALLRLEADLGVLVWTGLLTVGVFLLTALLGPIYCGYLCPAGALQELFGTLGAWLGWTRTLPRPAERLARFVKYVLLAVVIAGVLGLGSVSVANLDLLRAVWDPRRSLASFGLLILAGVGSLLTLRFGCRYLCPSGAFLNLANKLAPLRRYLPPKRYPSCDFGIRAYPDVDCIQCNRCRLGERLAPAPRSRTVAVQGLLAAMLVFLVLAAWPARPGKGTPASSQARVTPVDVNLVKLKVSAGKLSDKPALYWRVVRKP
jgi:hypothetical protein